MTVEEAAKIIAGDLQSPDPTLLRVYLETKVGPIKGEEVKTLEERIKLKMKADDFFEALMLQEANHRKEVKHFGMD